KNIDIRPIATLPAYRVRKKPRVSPKAKESVVVTASADTGFDPPPAPASPAPAAPPAAAAPLTASARLRAAREAQGLTVADV
ncbi:hypothetical protein ACJENI_24735, partial [Escherichia coli]